jgi:hypothetical protein
MTVLQGALESGPPVCRLHEHQSFELADFPMPSGREEERRFTPLHSSAKGTHPAAGGCARRHPPGGSPCVWVLSGSCAGSSLAALMVDRTVCMPPNESFAFPA